MLTHSLPHPVEDSHGRAGGPPATSEQQSHEAADKLFTVVASSLHGVLLTAGRSDSHIRWTNLMGYVTFIRQRVIPYCRNSRLPGRNEPSPGPSGM
jgi:hypothetical protein